MRSNMPFTLAILQFEPWDSLYTKNPPKEVRQLQRQFAGDITAILPSHVVAGQIAENRYGILFLEMAPREVDYFLSKLVEINHYSSAGKLRKTRMQIHIGWASFPQDATRSEELWPLAYQRLFADSHSIKGASKNTKSIDR
jgi:hypothetical protein